MGFQLPYKAVPNGLASVTRSVDDAEQSLHNDAPEDQNSEEVTVQQLEGCTPTTVLAQRRVVQRKLAYTALSVRRMFTQLSGSRAFVKSPLSIPTLRRIRSSVICN